MRASCLIRLLTLLILCHASPLFAQAPVVVQQSPVLLTACTTAHATAAVNTQATLTLTPPNGLYVYFCGWDVAISQNGTATANTNLSFTSTNLGGWAFKYSLPATANESRVQAFYFSFPVKSAQAGVAVTIVSPAAQVNTAFAINGYYYFAP